MTAGELSVRRNDTDEEDQTPIDQITLGRLEMPVNALVHSVQSLLRQLSRSAIGRNEATALLDDIKWQCTSVQALLGSDDSTATLDARLRWYKQDLWRLKQTRVDRASHLAHHPEERTESDVEWFKTVDRKTHQRERQIAQLEPEVRQRHRDEYSAPGANHTPPEPPLDRLPEGKTILADARRRVVVRREPEELVRAYRWRKGEWLRLRRVRDVDVALASVADALTCTLSPDPLPQTEEELRQQFAGVE